MKSDSVLDVLIIGAGISGIGCACHLAREMPGKSWAVFEARHDLGGTWDLFRYPGIRSDSDLYTFAYEFKPWTSANAIAPASEIMSYLRETADEYDVTDKIHFQHQVTAASWDSSKGLWSVEMQSPYGPLIVECRWIFSATGYYDYDEAFRPAFPDEKEFEGQIIHPQFWPEDFDPTLRQIAVIGSGATAITLVPALAQDAEHVTQIQRTPSYILARPQEDGLAQILRSVLPAKQAYRAIRWKNTRLQRYFYRFCQSFPDRARSLIRRSNIKQLPEGYDVDQHFTPPYNPWDQRLCAAPGGDFFETIKDGKASIATGHIERFERGGVRMKGGKLIKADTIVTATGLKLKMLGNIPFNVDGEEVDVSKRFVFRGMMLSDVPNMAFAIGYTNSSWTLKIDILCRYLCNLIKAMDDQEQTICRPVKPSEAMEARPLLDFDAGYVRRSINELPKQGPSYPWEMTLDYLADRKSLNNQPVIDPALELSTPIDIEPIKETEAA